MWWWDDYYYWPMPWMFGPLMMFIIMALCFGMMWFMMRGRHGPALGEVALRTSNDRVVSLNGVYVAACTQRPLQCTLVRAC